MESSVNDKAIEAAVKAIRENIVRWLHDNDIDDADEISEEMAELAIQAYEAAKAEDVKFIKRLKNDKLIGKIFGRLTVDSLVRGSKRVKYNCSCSCGGKTTALGTDLRSGYKKSCGCLIRETASKTLKNRWKKVREMDVDDFIKGNTSLPKHATKRIIPSPPKDKEEV